MADLRRYALVTGASSGIGWYISLELAARGYGIVAVSNQPQELQKLESELKAKNVDCIVFSCDLSTTEAAQQVFGFCEENNLEIEVLVNNAGILVFGEVINVNPAQVSTILQLHIHTPSMLCRLFAEKMTRAGQGHILNVSSISAVMPYPTISLYGPSKTFLRKFSRALRTELKPLGVNVTCLLPGATATALYDTDKVNISLAKRLGVMKSPASVARTGVNAMFRRKAESIPGLLNWMTMLLVPFVPHFVIALAFRFWKS